MSHQLLEEITYAMHSSDDYFSAWYFNIKEKIIYLNSDLLSKEEIDDDLERYIFIPRIQSCGQWEEMRDFILNLDAEDLVSRLLLTNIKGSGAFRQFKDALAQTGQLEKWYEYSSRVESQKALKWLLSENLIREQDVEEGLRLHDQAVAMRKQTKENLQKIQINAVVHCTYNTGHEGRITEGKQYTILDEKPQHLMIKIKNDENREAWFPKAHFVLVSN